VPTVRGRRRGGAPAGRERLREEVREKGGPAERTPGKETPEDYGEGSFRQERTVRVASMTLAITGITNPVSLRGRENEQRGR